MIEAKSRGGSGFDISWHVQDMKPNNSEHWINICSTKAELLQLNRTQFPSLGIFVTKKVGNGKNADHFRNQNLQSSSRFRYVAL